MRNRMDCKKMILKKLKIMKMKQYMDILKKKMMNQIHQWFNKCIKTIITMKLKLKMKIIQKNKKMNNNDQYNKLMKNIINRNN